LILNNQGGTVWKSCLQGTRNHRYVSGFVVHTGQVSKQQEFSEKNDTRLQQYPLMLMITSGQRILTTGRISRVDFSRGKYMWYWPAGSNAVGCSSRADAVSCWFIAAYTATATRDAFQWAGQPQKLRLPVGGSGLPI